jgi:hypothetical protein
MEREQRWLNANKMDKYVFGKIFFDVVLPHPPTQRGLVLPLYKDILSWVIKLFILSNTTVTYLY